MVSTPLDDVITSLETETEVVAKADDPEAELLREIHCSGCRVRSEVYRINGGQWQRYVAHEVDCPNRP